MKTLKSLDGRKGAPVDSIDVPNTDRSHDASKAITEKTDRQSTEDDSGRIQLHTVEEILGSEDLDTGGSTRSGCSSDGADGMFLQIPFPMVEERHDSNPCWNLSNTTFGSPSVLKLIATGKELGPCSTDEVGDEYDECTLDGDHGWFPLDGVRYVQATGE